jgi:hypothetical protein
MQVAVFLGIFLCVFSIHHAPAFAQSGSAAPNQTLGESLERKQSTKYYWDPAEKPCTLCNVVDIIVRPAEASGLVISNLMQPIIVKIWRVLFSIWITFTCGVIMIGGLDVKKAIGRFVLGILITIVLESMTVSESILTAGGDLAETGNLWFDFIYVPIRDVSVGLSMELMSEVLRISIALAGGAPSTGVTLPLPPNAVDMSRLSQLFAMIETSIFNVAVGAFFIEGEWWEKLVGFFRALILAIPFMFVLLIFAAFILESAFKFLAITATSPLWVVSAFFPFSRAWSTAAIRLYFSAAFTILFAAMAMGFTIGVTEQYRLDFICAASSHGPTCDQLGSDGAQSVLGDNQQIEALKDTYVGASSFWIMLFIGMVSVLLHLKAPTLAANISGANDSAAPAAAVVAAGKMLAGAAILGGTKKVAGAMGVPWMQKQASDFAQSGGLMGAGAKGAGKIGKLSLSAARDALKSNDV